MPQDEVKHVKSIDYDVLFECWAIADRLSAHALAADCEWAMTVLWSAEGVHMRAVLELSQGALQRVARSLGALCAGTRAARQEAPRAKRSLAAHDRHFLGIQLNNLEMHLKEAETPAATMLQWRMGNPK